MFQTEWLDEDQVIQIHDRALEVVILHVQGAYKKQGGEFARVLFFSHMRLWGIGPNATSNLLIQKAREHIEAYWKWSDYFCGVLLRPDGDEFLPLLLQKPALARKLNQPGDVWIDFTEIRKALNDA